MILHGRNLIIKAGGVAIAAAKSCDINVQCEETETASPSTGTWRTALTGRKSWQVTCGQLVTSIVRPISMVGTTVSLSMEVEGNYGTPFHGLVDNVTTSGTYSGDMRYMSGVYWDKTNKIFVLKCDIRGNIAYYTSWYVTTGPYPAEKYTSLSDGDTYYYDGQVYTYYNGDLHAEKLTGQANVVEWRGTGAVGNLCQGSFRFNGNGELAAASLPST